MELSDVVKILNRQGWTAKLINKGYGISVGTFWEFWSLTIKKNYAKNTLMISAGPTWLNWMLVLISGIQAFLSYQEKQPTFYSSLWLILLVFNIYRVFKERRQVKRLSAFLAAQGMRVE